MNKTRLLQPILILTTILYCLSPAYATWTDYKDARYIDLDGDFLHEIVIESKHGAGLGHYVEMMRIFKENEKITELSLIFKIWTLESWFGNLPDKPDSDTINEVEFTEPNIESGLRDIIVKSKKLYYKDKDHKIIEKEEDLGTKVYEWDGDSFTYNEKLSTSSVAQNELDKGASEAWIMGRLHAIDGVLQHERPPKERAELLYEKANLMYDAYKPKVGLRTLTECILEAIELDSDNQKYKDYLREIYNKEWKDRYFSGKDGYSELMIQLKNRVESNIGKNE